MIGKQQSEDVNPSCFTRMVALANLGVRLAICESYTKVGQSLIQLISLRTGVPSHQLNPYITSQNKRNFLASRHEPRTLQSRWFSSGPYSVRRAGEDYPSGTQPVVVPQTSFKRTSGSRGTTPQPPNGINHLPICSSAAEIEYGVHQTRAPVDELKKILVLGISNAPEVQHGNRELEEAFEDASKVQVPQRAYGVDGGRVYVLLDQHNHQRHCGVATPPAHTFSARD